MLSLRPEQRGEALSSFLSQITECLEGAEVGWGGIWLMFSSQNTWLTGDPRGEEEMGRIEWMRQRNIQLLLASILHVPQPPIDSLGGWAFCEIVFAILNYETASPLVLGQIAILISRQVSKRGQNKQILTMETPGESPRNGIGWGSGTVSFRGSYPQQPLMRGLDVWGVGSKALQYHYQHKVAPHTSTCVVC